MHKDNKIGGRQKIRLSLQPGPNLMASTKRGKRRIYRARGKVRTSQNNQFMEGLHVLVTMLSPSNLNAETLMQYLGYAELTLFIYVFIYNLYRHGDWMSSPS